MAGGVSVGKFPRPGLRPPISNPPTLTMRSESQIHELKSRQSQIGSTSTSSSSSKTTRSTTYIIVGLPPMWNFRHASIDTLHLGCCCNHCLRNCPPPSYSSLSQGTAETRFQTNGLLEAKMAGLEAQDQVRPHVQRHSGARV